MRTPVSLRRIIVLAAALLLASACGTRLSQEELLSAGEGGSETIAGGSSSAAGVGVGRPGAAGASSSGSPASDASASSGDGSGGGGGAVSPEGSPTGVAGGEGGAVASGSEITIATVATISGPVASFVGDSVDTVGVWAHWVNSRGGVNGHPVRHLALDDGGDPARYNALVQQAVEQEGAIAFVFNTIGFAGGSLDYVESNRIPIIGHEAGTNLVYDSPMVFTPFPSGSNYAVSLVRAFGSVAVPAGQTRLASLACSDVALCDLFDEAWTGQPGRDAGFEVVYRARPSLTQPDFTAECLSARQAGANAMILAVDNNSVLRIAHACARQGYHPLIGMADQLALPSVAEDPIAEGIVVGTKVAPWPATDTPGMAELYEAFAQFAPGVEVHGGHVAAWVAAQTFGLAAANLPADPTAEDVLEGLWAIDGQDIGGLTFPLRFPREQPSPRATCFGVVVIHEQTFTAPHGGGVSCI